MSKGLSRHKKPFDAEVGTRGKSVTITSNKRLVAPEVHACEAGQPLSWLA